MITRDSGFLGHHVHNLERCRVGRGQWHAGSDKGGRLQVGHELDFMALWQ